MDYLDTLLTALKSGPLSGEVVNALAVGGGLNPNGSFLTENANQLTRQQRLTMVTKVPGLHVFLPPPKAPPAIVGAAHNHRGCLRPSDYLGLGVDPCTGAFRLGLLVQHCEALPAVSEDTAKAVFQEPGRRLCCQAIGCIAVIRADSGWMVCGGCRLALVCQLCTEQPCRICLFNSTPTEFPVDWMHKRCQPMSKITDDARKQAGYDNTENVMPWETALNLLAVQAAYRKAGPRSSRAT